MEQHPAIISDVPQKDSEGAAIILRLMQQVKLIEDVLAQFGSIEMLMKRIKNMEDTLYTNKEILSLDEASLFLNASKSQLYKLTRTLAIPHYKPGGKAIYFYKSEILEWVKEHPIKKEEKVTAITSHRLDNAKQ